jgi:hypothetical protein
MLTDLKTVTLSFSIAIEKKVSYVLEVFYHR